MYMGMPLFVRIRMALFQCSVADVGGSMSGMEDKEIKYLGLCSGQ